MENKEAISILQHMRNLITVRTFEEKAIDKAIEALEKQIPKKVDVWVNGKEYCPRCEQDMSCLGFKVCISCGQALKWG